MNPGPPAPQAGVIIRIDDEPLSMLFSGLLHSRFYYLSFARRAVVCVRGKVLKISIAKDLEVVGNELDENCDADASLESRKV